MSRTSLFDISLQLADLVVTADAPAQFRPRVTREEFLAEATRAYEAFATFNDSLSKGELLISDGQGAKKPFPSLPMEADLDSLIVSFRETTKTDGALLFNKYIG